MAEDKTGSPTDDWEEYEKARIRNDQIHGEHLRAFSQRSYEYGALSVKNLTLISGGAIIAIPAIAGISPKLSAEVAAASGMWFVAALLLSVACTYVIHLNWSFNYDQRDAEYDRDHARIVRAFLPSRANEYEDDKSYYRTARKFYRLAWWTYAIPHILGILGYLAFLGGCWTLYDGFSKGIG